MCDLFVSIPHELFGPASEYKHVQACTGAAVERFTPLRKNAGHQLCPEGQATIALVPYILIYSDGFHSKKQRNALHLISKLFACEYNLALPCSHPCTGRLVTNSLACISICKLSIDTSGS